MSRRNPPAKWVLPMVVNPPTSTCWMVPVPDDPFHKAAFLGALAALGAAYKWQDDLAHTARDVANVWREIADNLEKCQPPTTIIRTYQSEEKVAYRVDCDCNVFFECCDGTEIQVLNATQVEDMVRGLPKGDARQPQPGGGCATYNKTLTGPEHVLIPVPVSTGDVITLEHFEGASNEHGFARWLCGDGGEYFAGACSGFQYFDGSAYMPAAPLGTLIVNIDGVYYDGRSPITVPGGITNKQPFALLNYDPTSALSGTLTFDAEVCNNQEATWCYEIDFSLTPGSFAPVSATTGTPGTWNSGSGWASTDWQNPNGNYYRGVEVHRVFSGGGIHITELDMLFDLAGHAVQAGHGGNAVYLVKNSASLLASITFAAETDADGQHLTWSGDESGVTDLDIAVLASYYTDGTYAGSSLIRSLKISGVGTNPFGTSNC